MLKDQGSLTSQLPEALVQVNSWEAHGHSRKPGPSSCWSWASGGLLVEHLGEVVAAAPGAVLGSLLSSGPAIRQEAENKQS